MLRNFKLTTEYDGTLYNGWQRQANRPTIQERIEKALSTMTGEKVILTGSGRTDAGVHALGQVANFHSESSIHPDDFRKGLNSLLPDDIVIKECIQVAESFHARYDAKSKTYHYRILNAATPAAVGRHYAWFIRKTLDVNAMRTALRHIVGTHDFTTFEGAGSPRSHAIRSVLNADFIPQDHGCLVFQIEADGFLRYMVRNIVGTLVDVGHCKITPDDVKNIISLKDRSLAGITAPPHGLFLMHVEY